MKPHRTLKRQLTCPSCGKRGVPRYKKLGRRLLAVCRYKGCGRYLKDVEREEKP